MGQSFVGIRFKSRPAGTVDLGRLLGCSLETILTGGPDYDQLAAVGPDKELDASCAGRRGRMVLPRAQKLEALQHALESDETPSVNQVAATLGIDGSGLRRSCLEETTMLAKKWREYQERSYVMRLDERLEACRTAFAQLEAEGRVPGTKSLMKYSGGKLTFFSDRDFSLAQRVARESGTKVGTIG